MEKSDITPKEIEDIRLEYCDLLDSAWNHTTYDYYCTVFQSTGSYRTNRWTNKVSAGFCWGKIWRAVVMTVLIALPAVVYYLCGVI